MVIIGSSFAHLALPETSLFSFIFERKDRQYPDSHAIFQDAETGKAYSYGEVKQTAVDFGQGLMALRQWRKGDILALFAPNHIDTPAVIMGTLWAGGIVSPANPGYTAAELAHQLIDSGARAVVTQWHLLGTVKQACRLASLAEDSIILQGSQRDPTGRIPHYTSIRNISGRARYRPAECSAKTDVSFLVYSSGTTGRPKGVKLSHFNLTSNISQLQPGEQHNLTWDGSKTCGDIPLPSQRSGGDKVLACLPFFHIYGLTTTVFNPLYTGTTEIVMARFEIEEWCSLVHQHSITFSYIVPPIVLLLCKHPAVEKYNLSSIRMTNSGAAPLSRDMVEMCFKRTGIRVKQGYGLSETSPTAFNQPWDDWNVTIGSVGQVLSNMEAKVCTPFDVSDEKAVIVEAEPLPQGQVGELHIRGPNIFLGYHNNDAATKECLSDSGWFRTGDVGYFDRNGNLFITDRVKELIKYKGFQVAPAELEGCLLEHPSIKDCAVVGLMSDDLGTEVPRAYVVTDGSRKPQEACAIVTWLGNRVANHKKLRGGVVFVDEIPKTASGKILRKVLREWAKAEAGKLDCSARGAAGTAKL